jgi:hypothetical protein
MAMEVKFSKQLHKPALPIALLLIGLFIVSTLALTRIQPTNITRALTTGIFRIKPASNGLAHISLETSQSSTSPNLDQAGRSASLTFEMQ